MCADAMIGPISFSISHSQHSHFILRSGGFPSDCRWALVSATVGLVLRIIENRSEKVGRFVAGLLGMAWTLVSFLVIPILVVENKGPLVALKESTQLLKKTWGEQLVGNFSFGLLFFLLGIPAYGLILLGIVSGSGATALVCIGFAAVYLI